MKAGPSWPLPGVAALLPATVLLAACSLVSRSEPPVADLTGTYSGILRLEGEEIPATLRVTQDAGRVEVALSAAVGLDAKGQGRLEGTVFRVELGYGEDCRGTLKLAGQALDQGQRLVGIVEVEDCTGPAEGSFSLSRR